MNRTGKEEQVRKPFCMYSFVHLLAPIALALPVTLPVTLAVTPPVTLAVTPAVAAPIGSPSASPASLVANLAAIAPGNLPVALPANLDTAQQPYRTVTVGVLIPLLDEFDDEVWNQVHIEQRVIIRVAPLMLSREAIAPVMEPLAEAMVPISPSMNVRVRERKAGKCMPAAGISSVQPVSDGRLLFHLRDRRMVAARLEKACNARDFYMGFYMSKTPDGQLCVNRDQIHSRAGTTCAIKEVREFVPVEP